jgi:16S rRNA (guanine966-N2)-methyltransferase
MRIKLPIIAGSLKRRSIEIKKDENLRPVMTRVRQTMFDILFNLIDLENKRVLDVCCGSGILGVESISRGAEMAIFMDINKNAILELKQNCTRLEIFHKSKFYTVNALTPPKGEVVDVLFIDPPYESNFLIAKILRRLFDSKWINEATIIIIPMDRKFQHTLKESYNIIRSTEISSTNLMFLQKIV